MPIFLVSLGYKELNRREPDCGTTFTWGTKAFGPKTGWLGGWGIIAADVLVMASLAQVAGQYGFDLFGAHGIGGNATSGWVLLVGIMWIVVMTWICYIGIEISANFQKILLSIEVVMLAVFSVTALVKVYTNKGTDGSSHVSLSWFNPAHIGITNFLQGILLMLFIYWGWDSAVSVNEETKDRERTPGRAAVISTVLLLRDLCLGIGLDGCVRGRWRQGHRPCQPRQLQRRHHDSGWRSVRVARCRAGVLQATDADGAFVGRGVDPDDDFADRPYDPRDGGVQGDPEGVLQDPPPVPHADACRRSQWAVSRSLLYLLFNFVAAGNIIPDSVTAIGWFIAFYYGLTGFACTWYYRHELRHSSRDLWVKGIIPSLGGVMLFGVLIVDMRLDWNPVRATPVGACSSRRTGHRWHLPHRRADSQSWAWFSC